MSLVNITPSVTLDIYDHNLTPSSIKTIALDSNTRFVAAVIRNRGEIYDIGQDAAVALTVVRPDKTRVQITGQTYSLTETTRDDETITYYGASAELTQLALAIKGSLRAQFKITSGTQELRTEIFTINNGEALDAGDDPWAGDLDGHNLDEMAQSIEDLSSDVSEIQEDVTELKSGLNEVYDGKPVTVKTLNILDTNSVASGKNLKDDGTLVDNASYNTTDFISLTDANKANIAFTSSNAAGTGRVVQATGGRFCFYAQDKTTLLSSFFSNDAHKICPIDETASYVRISYKDTYTSRYPMLEYVDQDTDISSVYVPYEETVSVSHGINYIDNKQQEIDRRLTEVETDSGSIPNLKAQVSQNTAEITAVKGDPVAMDYLADFSNGNIVSTTGKFDGGSYYKYRVATPNIVDVDKDYAININPNYRVYVAFFTSDDTYISGGWREDGYVLAANSRVRIMIAKTSEDQSSTADVDVFCSNVTVVPQNSLLTLTNRIETVENSLSASIDYGLTWDWWISANSVDDFGNAYMGYVDTDGYAGILRRQPDGTMHYKRLEKLANDDDHNGCATIVLDDGRILAIGSYGHSSNNHIVCWRSVKPYSIEEMEQLSFNIPQDGDYTYKTTYSQCFKYNGMLFNFLRCIAYGESGAVGYICLVSSDNGTTWTAYKAIVGSDPYVSFAYASDDKKILKATFARNPSASNATIRAFTFDMETQKFYNMAGTEIGHLVLLDGGTVDDENIAHHDDMTFVRNQSTSDAKVRLLFTASAEKATTKFLYAVGDDSTSKDFTYYVYNGAESIAVGKSGIPFGNGHYICGACFGNDIDTIYYAKAKTTKADGAHELHKVKIVNDAVASDEIITEASMCILRPLFLGNGELAAVVGRYNDQNDDGTYNGSFTAWELKPLFTHA